MITGLEEKEEKTSAMDEVGMLEESMKYVFGVAYSNEFLHINYQNMSEILLDIITLFFISGMILYTRVYRKRGRLCDKLFFVALILNVMMAVSDMMVALFNQSSVPCAGVIIRICATLLQVTVAMESYVYVLYLMSLLDNSESVIKKFYKPAAIPGLAMIVVMIANIFGEFVFSVDPRAGAFTFEDLTDIFDTEDDIIIYVDSGVGAFNLENHYYLIIIGLVIYFSIGQVLFWHVNKTAILMFVIYAVSCYILAVIMPGISVAPILYAVILIYTLVGAMNRAFFSEKGGEKDGV